MSKRSPWRSPYATALDVEARRTVGKNARPGAGRARRGILKIRGRPMPAPPAGKLPKDYERLPVPQPQATSVRKRDPKMLAVIDPGKCFGRGCEYCIAVCPVPGCITLTTDPNAPELSVCT